ncbi:MAG TPA: protein-L-isoaspartate(D-aspartate) O-methyltransferase [Acidimicrobiales bacterium]|jgi:protein-L-isoaspartate(D-aspartate) O-methyltransferase|nr:protein-L-isoaspartate(D-aspartate) O-methyltransferase [Acidimicrobiales bacterium]
MQDDRNRSAARRAEMVRLDLLGRGVADEQVLAAMAIVPREEFVPESLEAAAYEDRALPLVGGQTISQPYVVALMIEALQLEPDDVLLEVGSGSGYAAAVASRICARVIGIERVPELAEASAARLARLGYTNVRIVLGDGSLGHPEDAPYDAVLVSAGAPAVPPAIVDQLVEGGRLVIPIGAAPRAQHLWRFQRRGDALVEADLGGVAFVPLVGEQGWPTVL